ncbi:hypothetical protein B0H10DRAFT_1945354 [Mycena sp. CBHHK59/15]|nr:hypothetical protein B0H10DRAFT_1945354 [Mycena sp. CBHHK59/15]
MANADYYIKAVSLVKSKRVKHIPSGVESEREQTLGRRGGPHAGDICYGRVGGGARRHGWREQATLSDVAMVTIKIMPYQYFKISELGTFKIQIFALVASLEPSYDATLVSQ